MTTIDPNRRDRTGQDVYVDSGVTEFVRTDFKMSDRCVHCNQDLLWLETIQKWIAQDQRKPPNVAHCPKQAERLANKTLSVTAGPGALNHEPEIVREVDTYVMPVPHA